MSSSLDSELSALHSRIYPSFAPLEASKIDLSLLGVPFAGAIRPKKSRRDVHIEQYSVVPSPKLNQVSDGYPSDLEWIDSGVLDPRALSTCSRYSPGYIDHRLDRLNIRMWINAPITNQFAAGAISLFMANEQPLVAFFDPDLFLDDLISGGETYCSSLLVSSLMFFACVSTYIFQFIPDR